MKKSVNFELPIIFNSHVLKQGQILYYNSNSRFWFTPQFKAIIECRPKKFSQAEIQNKRGRKVALKPVRQNLFWCGRGEVFKRSYVLITKEDEDG